MNEKKLKQLNVLLILIILTAIISIFVFVLNFSPENKNNINYDSIKEYNKGWVLKEHRGEADEIIKLPTKVKADAGEVIVLMNRVPNDVNSTSVMMFETKFQNVIVMAGDRQIYANGVLNNQKLMKNAVPCINIVDLSDVEQGEIISIYMVSSYKSYNGKIPVIYYGTRGDAVARIIRKDGAGFVFAITLLVIIIILGISLFAMKNAGVNKRKTMYAFMFAALASIWSLLENRILQLLTKNVFGIYTTGMVVLLVLPVLYMIYQRSIVKKKKLAKIFEIGIYVFAINFITGIIFQLMSVCDFASYMIFTKILITLALIGISVVMYIAAETYSDRSIYSNFWSNLVITAACLLEAFFSLFKFYMSYDGVILQFGILAFIVLMIVTAQKQLIKQVNMEKENISQGVEFQKEVILNNINTKFIYSSLNTVMSNLKDSDREDSRHIYDTSIYMKHNLDSIRNQGTVPFELELEYIKAFAGMAKQQNAGLEIIVEVKINDFVVPYSSIELLVENAVINGALKAKSHGKVVIRSYERLDCYAIQIVDNGPGLGPDRRFHDKKGFKNVKKRLKSLCGAAVEVKARSDRGTIVTIKIPKAGYIIKE